MTTVDVVKSGSLGEVNVGLSAALALMQPLQAQLDALLNFSLGPLQADLATQLNANVNVALSLGLSIGDPLSALQRAITAVIQLQANLQAAFALGIPPPSLQVGTQIQALASASVALKAKLGLLDAMIQAAFRARLGSVNFIANLQASLSAGPVFVLSFDGISTPTPMAGVGVLIAEKMAQPITDPGNPGPNLQPHQPVAGVILLCGAGATFSAMGAILPT